MATDRQLDQTITRWLEADAPAQLPDRVLRATFERTRSSRQHVGMRARLGRLELTRSVVALGGAAAVVVVAAALALNFSASPPRVGGPLPADDPRSPFLGTWLSTSDADGGTQTMTVRATGEDAVEIVVLDDLASVCSGASSTMIGTGQLRGAGELVIPSPAYTCDDGSEPRALSGPPLEEQLRNLTFVLDAQTETLSDNFGGVWLREGAEDPSPGPTTSGGMWPQTSLEEVRQAQERADAGDPDYTWQVGARLMEADPNNQVELELMNRFLREVLGWEAYKFNEGGVFSDWTGAGMNGWVEGSVTGQRYIRCAPGRANPLDPDEPCAPTLDDLRYETVSLDIAQLDRQGRDGIWVVSAWKLTEPFAQADPTAVEAQARERLNAFLAARIAGHGADGFVDVGQNVPDVDVPLLYATSSGAPYERYEIERVAGPWWPTGGGRFSVRLLADGGATVVEQVIQWGQGARLSLDANSTTENGQPVVLSYTSSDGEVTVSAPSTWKGWWPD